MTDSAAEILRFVREQDVKFVRLTFCDLFGLQKNIAVMAAELPRIFESGMIFDASAVRGLAPVEHSDLFLMPDCSTISILPWRPSHERVVRIFCDIQNPDGTEFIGDSRALLKKAVQRAADMGYFCSVGAECEFYLFHLDEQGDPTTEPLDYGSYGDLAPLDKAEDIRREICLTLEEMDIRPEKSHHESGLGQNEVDFRYSEALSAADNLMTFKTVVKSIAMMHRLYASFLPKPMQGQFGNGMHINLSLMQGGRNLFETGKKHCPYAESFLAGILSRTAEMTAFLNPLVNSYERLGLQEAPRYISWSHQNRSQLIRIPATTGAANRMELRSPDPSCNPYLAFALLLHAGLDGIEEQAALPAACDRNLFETGVAEQLGIGQLPGTLSEALDLAEGSAWIRKVLPEEVRTQYMKQKRWEWEQIQKAEDPWKAQMQMYFRSI